MAVDIQKLETDLKIIKKGSQMVSIIFSGIVDSISDNPIALTLFIDPGAPVFTPDDEGTLKKTISWKQTFPTTLGSMNKPVKFNVTIANSVPGSCSLRLEAKDSKGSRSAKNSHIIYFK